MSEEAIPSPEAVEAEVKKPARAKRAPKAKSAASKKAERESAPVEPGPTAAVEPVASVQPETDAHAIEVPVIGEPDAAGETASSSKRKRRRRKGKGGSQHSSESAEREEFTSGSRPEALAAESVKPANPGVAIPHQGRRLDPDLVAKKAWKIFLAEVSEEGVALIGDHDAKELSRRCFRLAEIFLEERSRRR